jgi:hypothetical protein
MSGSTDHITLVRQAQQGLPEARQDLVRLVEVRLAEYVGRLTLDRDLTTDIVQETPKCSDLNTWDRTLLVLVVRDHAEQGAGALSAALAA